MKLIKKCILLFSFIAGLTNSCVSQEKPAVLDFRSIFSAGLINGKASTSADLQMVHGFLIRKSFAGAGIGIDYYKFRTIPLFLHMRQELGSGKRNAFLYGSGGYSIDWLTDNSKQNIHAARSTFKGGWYYDIGLGYKIELRRENAFLLSAGYSLKQLRRTDYVQTCLAGAPCSEEKELYQYSLTRVAVRFAFQF